MSLAYVFSILSQAVNNFMLSMENTHDIFCFKGDKNNFNWYKIQIIFFSRYYIWYSSVQFYFLKISYNFSLCNKGRKS